MQAPTPTIRPLGESAVVVEFGDVISESLNQLAISLCEELNSHPFAGFIEAFPAYSSATVFYDLVQVRRSFPQFKSAFSSVESLILQTASRLSINDIMIGSMIEVPVDFSARSGLDLESVALSCGLTVEKVIEIFTKSTYRVFMVGFLPGFAYMGEVDRRIRQPRRQQPRLKVPKGSVAIAGSQTGVYPLETPGGWQILGKTDIEFFRPFDATPSLLKPGDQVRFVAV
jgi:inhibitor of KinA